ncbi:MAG TPA: thiamine phosphate synthase [Syntrophobacteria bacterium]|nr:thiamine phosphate synthase [Syntrophobacteria bacterium]
MLPEVAHLEMQFKVGWAWPTTWEADLLRWAVPTLRVLKKVVAMTREERKARFKEIDVYPVTYERLSARRSNLEVLEAVVRGGARIIQLREKEYSKRDLYRLALTFREMSATAGMLLIMNDHLDIALAVGADGVHLGQDDFPPKAARGLAPELLIGVSTHSLEQALQAEKDGADYVNIGPIFATSTKAGVGRPLGPEAIASIGPRLSVPFTVMGGITSANLDQVLAHGARRIAMITAITQEPDIAEAVRVFRARIRNYAS